MKILQWCIRNSVWIPGRKCQDGSGKSTLYLSALSDDPKIRKVIVRHASMKKDRCIFAQIRRPIFHCIPRMPLFCLRTAVSVDM